MADGGGGVGGGGGGCGGGEAIMEKLYEYAWPVPIFLDTISLFCTLYSTYFSHISADQMRV